MLGLLIALVVLLAVSIIVINAVLGASGKQIPGGLTVRFFVVDLLVIAAMKWRKKLLGKARGLAAEARARMGSTPFGGSAPAQLGQGGEKRRSTLGKVAAAGLMIGAVAATGGSAAALGASSAGRGALSARLTARGVRGGLRFAGRTAAGTTRTAVKAGRLGLRYTAGAPVNIPRAGRAARAALEAAPGRVEGLQQRLAASWNSPARQQWRAEWTHHTGLRALGNRIRAHRGMPPTPRPDERRFIPPRPSPAPTVPPAPTAPPPQPVQPAPSRPRRAPLQPGPASQPGPGRAAPGVCPHRPASATPPPHSPGPSTPPPPPPPAPPARQGPAEAGAGAGEAGGREALGVHPPGRFPPLSLILGVVVFVVAAVSAAQDEEAAAQALRAACSGDTSTDTTGPGAQDGGGVQKSASSGRRAAPPTPARSSPWPERGLPHAGHRSRWPPPCRNPGCATLNHGDRDSLGLFQQRPSQGWTASQVTNPDYAAGKFFDHLTKIPDWGNG